MTVASKSGRPATTLCSQGFMVCQMPCGLGNPSAAKFTAWQCSVGLQAGMLQLREVEATALRALAENVTRVQREVRLICLSCLSPVSFSTSFEGECKNTLLNKIFLMCARMCNVERLWQCWRCFPEYSKCRHYAFGLVRSTPTSAGKSHLQGYACFASVRVTIFLTSCSATLCG